MTDNEHNENQAAVLNNSIIIGIVESVLFLENEALSIIAISRITKLSKSEIENALAEIKNEFNKDFHGIELDVTGELYQFYPKRKLWDPLKERYGKKNEKKLSRAAMETLAIIAYSQPVTRGEVESIRGVSSDSMFKLLLSKEIIKEVGKKDAPGKPVQYGTTNNFLKLFSLSSISELPKLDDVDNERFKYYDE
jgi:segregation and condensation protein B